MYNPEKFKPEFKTGIQETREAKQILSDLLASYEAPRKNDSAEFEKWRKGLMEKAGLNPATPLERYPLPIQLPERIRKIQNRSQIEELRQILPLLLESAKEKFTSRFRHQEVKAGEAEKFRKMIGELNMDGDPEVIYDALDIHGRLLLGEVNNLKIKQRKGELSPEGKLTFDRLVEEIRVVEKASDTLGTMIKLPEVFRGIEL